jgi:hypothetical protein
MKIGCSEREDFVYFVCAWHMDFRQVVDTKSVYSINQILVAMSTQSTL